MTMPTRADYEQKVIVRRVVKVGQVSGWNTAGNAKLLDLWVTLELRNANGGIELGISAVEGPRANGDAYGGCGQCRDSLRELVSHAPGWDSALIAKLADIWDRWHLNLMRAGSPAQEQWLRDNPDEAPAYPASHYEWQCGRLANAGLNPDPDTGYSYGHTWLNEELPADVIEFVRGLPTTTVTHPWNDSDRDRWNEREDVTQ